MTDYERIRELAENATPGPWWTDNEHHRNTRNPYQQETI